LSNNHQDWTMNKKQKRIWNDCHSLLMSVLSEKDVPAIYDKAVDRWRDFSSKMDHESDSRKNMAVDSILPRVALYAVLKENGYPAEQIMTKYVEEIAGPAMHAKYAGMERIPGFFSIYRRIFMLYTDRSDWWECSSEKTPDGFKLDIHKCLWKDCCDVVGYPEVCRFFCDCDDITYGGLHKVGFKRTRTLGKGGDHCDFEFYRKPTEKG